jgi:hypothetical protein
MEASPPPAQLIRKRENMKAALSREAEAADHDSSLRPEKQRPVRKSVTYSGHAEADGRPATLELNFVGNKVSGRLQAKGVSGDNVRLPTTNISFAPVPLNGAWESDDTTIFAHWKGGDYIDGTLVPDYPTRGNLSINLAERGGEKVVYLHRISSSGYGYVFPSRGIVYTPPEVAHDTTPTAGNGYWDPVGSWSGEAYYCSIKAEVKKTGDITVVVACEKEVPEYRKGWWKRQGNGIKVIWTKATIEKNKLDESSIYAYFDGANCLIIDEGDGDYNKIYRNPKPKKEKPHSKPEKVRPQIDPKKIEKIVLIPGKFKAEPEKSRALPGIYGVDSETGEQVLLQDLEVVWGVGTEISVAGNQLTVHKGVKNGTTIQITADVSIGFRDYKAKAEIEVAEDLVTGFVHGSVSYYYSKAALNHPRKWPMRPLSAVITLTGPGGAERRQNIGPNGKFRFDNLEKGLHYVVKLNDVNTDNLPSGWQSAFKQPWSSGNFHMPGHDYLKGEVWEANMGLQWKVINPDIYYEGCVHGFVTYKGKPVRNAKVMLVGHLGRQKRIVVTGYEGEYKINADGLDGGRYTVSALKMMGADKSWATKKDLIGPVEAGREVPAYLGIPLSDPRGVQIDIPCLSRGEIFH